MGLTTYWDFAENDYQFFEINYKSGVVANSMGAIAQNTCERYLKHIISLYSYPQNEREISQKNSALTSHNLNTLIKYLKNNMGISLPIQTVSKLKEINGYYFSTRYPGDLIDILDKQDIEECHSALIACRKAVYLIEQNFKTALQQPVESDLENRNQPEEIMEEKEQE